MSDTANSRTEPRAIIRKRILDTADEKPDAAIETIAETIPGATAELIERILNEYGKPGQSLMNEPHTPLSHPLTRRGAKYTLPNPSMITKDKPSGQYASTQ